MHHLYPLHPATHGVSPVVVAAALRACRHALSTAWLRRQRRRRARATFAALDERDDRHA